MHRTDVQIGDRVKIKSRKKRGDFDGAEGDVEDIEGDRVMVRLRKPASGFVWFDANRLEVFSEKEE